MKTYITLPYRDRNGKYKNALEKFIHPFLEYCHENIKKDFLIFIVEQSESHELFNLGRTINIGFDINKEKINNEDIFIFHPIDILPINVNYNIRHTTKFCSKIHSPNGDYYKGIGFLSEDFKNINGFSNEYWGWGGEDDDMKIRLNCKNIQVETKVDNYIHLCDDGNCLPGEPLFAPTLQKNWNMASEMKLHKNCFISGLNTLNYKILDTVDYKGIIKYIIE